MSETNHMVAAIIMGLTFFVGYVVIPTLPKKYHSRISSAVAAAMIIVLIAALVGAGYRMLTSN